MKRIKPKAILFIFFILAYLLFGAFLVNRMTKQMSDDYYQLMGTKALDLARVASKQLNISDEEFAELKSISYAEMLHHPLNTQLQEIFSGGKFSSEVKYAYLWTLLEPDEVKYTVTAEDAEYYNVDPGTPLGTIWLLDVVVNEYVDEDLDMDAIEEYYGNDQNRYTTVRPYDDD
ncbi:MAG: hypothetical protein RR472_04340, partial [Anaerovoracaceae bacterium]